MKKKNRDRQIETDCVHGGLKPTCDASGAISIPIYQSATFAHPGVGQSTGYDYSRLQNPTRESLENLVKTLENGYDAIAFATGMAAITTVMQYFNQGDHIIASDDLYGGSHRLFDNFSIPSGISMDFLRTMDTASLKQHLRANTKAIFIETPSNPMMHVIDIQLVSSFCKEHDLLLIVDNTFMTPYFQQPLNLGANIVIHSGTKFLSGHNDVLSGFIIVDSEDLSERFRYIAKTIGAILSPMESWLMIRGIKTLALRLEAQQKNAVEIVAFLKQHPSIVKCHYVGSQDHPGYPIMLQQAKGFGSMISFEVKTPAIAKQLLESVKIIQYAESLGGVESLMTYPMLQTHADVPEDERKRKGINECLLRLSVGIENISDLIRDLNQALEA